MKPITVVYNSKSGSAVNAGDIRRMFNHNKLPLAQLVPLDDRLASNLAAPIQNGEHIAVIGGDGTIGAVAGLMVGTDATLIPLPGGTLNHFIKDLGIAQDLETAIANIATSTTKLIDTATVNDIIFINNSSIGLYPHSLKARERIEDAFGKWPAALVGIIRALVRFKTYDIAINGEVFQTPFIFVGNNNYKLEQLGGINRDSLTAGELSVYIVKSNKRSALMRIFFAALLRRLHNLDTLPLYAAQEVTITSRKHPHIHVSHDGEVTTLDSPITYRTRPKSLRVNCL